MTLLCSPVLEASRVHGPLPIILNLLPKPCSHVDDAGSSLQDCAIAKACPEAVALCRGGTSVGGGLGSVLHGVARAVSGEGALLGGVDGMTEQEGVSVAMKERRDRLKQSLRVAREKTADMLQHLEGLKERLSDTGSRIGVADVP
jgi:hypothetical protein